MIYLIKSGQYSDTEIHGYFTDAEDAYVYCDLHNKRLHNDAEERLENVDDDFFFHRKFYVEPIREIRAELPPRPPQYYFFRFEFHNRASGGGFLWVMNHPDKPWKISNKDQVLDDPTEVWGWKCRGLVEDFYKVEVILKKWDSELAAKIAQDYFYQIIAKQENLSI